MQAGAPLPELDGPPHRPPPVLPYGNDLTDAEFRELKMYLHALSHYENKHISDSLYRQIADRLGSLTAPPLSEAQRAEIVQIFQQHVAAAAPPVEAPPASDDAQVLQA
ncbi:hypothetical protein ACK3TF_001764 [Chlorella vulgaris]